MKRLKWILATAALMIGMTGGAFAEQQRWSDPRDAGSAYAPSYEGNRNYNRTYARNDGYRDHDGDRDNQGYWRQRVQRDNRDQNRSHRDHQYRGHDRD